jgi:hypothetical protein
VHSGGQKRSDKKQVFGGPNEACFGRLPSMAVFSEALFASTKTPPILPVTCERLVAHDVTANSSGDVKEAPRCIVSLATACELHRGPA